MVTREKMGEIIFSFEAQRDKAGRLKVYNPPAGDLGGAFEVAGVNVDDHPAEAYELSELINDGRHLEAESRAKEIILDYTEPAARWSRRPAIELFLRDSYFNRGPGGAAKILQLALGGLAIDGKIGQKTLEALAGQEHDARRLIGALRMAREAYELTENGYRTNLWRGLVNRWEKLTALCNGFSSENGSELR